MNQLVSPIAQRYEEQCIRKEELDSIIFKPGTKLKLESGRKNIKDGKNELHRVRYCEVAGNYPNYILCSFKHSRGYFYEVLNKVDIACGDIRISVVEE